MTTQVPLDGGARPGDNLGRAIALTLASIAIFSAQDAMSKILVQHHSPFQVVMIRYWAFAAFSLFLVSRQGPLTQAFRSHAPWWQWARGVLLVADIWLFALAVRTVPLAELQSIVLVYPLLVTLFAVPFLGERLGVFRIGAVVAGFVGAMVIVRPGGLPVDAGVLFALASSGLYALYIVVTRKVSSRDTTATSMVYAGVGGLVLSSAVGVFFWTPMDWPEMALMAAVMVTTCAGHGLMMVALSMAPASAIQPFNYFSLPFAITLSFLVFGHLIDPVSLVGAAVIVAAGLVVMARERMKRVRAVGMPGLPGRE